MLSAVFTGETCAKCRNCCVFEEQSAWELPTFSAASAARLKGDTRYQVTECGGRFRITLPYDALHKAQPCPFLDDCTGCILPPEEKPFACSVWPVRVMPDAKGKPALTLYQGCPGVPEEKLDLLRDLLANGLRARILEEAERDPSLVLPYHPNYRYI